MYELVLLSSYCKLKTYICNLTLNIVFKNLSIKTVNQ